MNKFVKSLVIGVTALGLTASAVSTASARPWGERHHGGHHHHRGGGWGGGGLAAGLFLGATGLILSDAIRNDRRRVYIYEDDDRISCRELAYRCDDGSRRSCRMWRRYCD